MSDSVNAEIARGVNPLQMASQALQLQTGRYQLQQAQLQPAYQAMRQLQMTNPNASWNDVMGALAQSKRIGADVSGLVANANEIMSNGGSPTDFIHAQSIGGMTPWEQGMLTGPQQHAFQTAQGTIYGTMGGPWSKQAGQFTPGGFVQQGLSPEQWATPTDVFDPKTQTYTRQPFGQAYGYPMPPGLGGGGAGGGQGGGGGQGTSASHATYNFGNIRAPGGGFASYDTPQAGIAAMASNLGAYQDQHGISTLNGITARWAPKGDGANDPAAYASTLSKLTGIDPNAQLNLHDPATLAKIIPAMAQVERGRPMAVGGDVLNEGIQMASGGGSGGAPSSVASRAAPPSGPFIGATSAQPVSAPSAVQPAGGMQYFSPTGQPVSPGGEGQALPPHTLALPPPGFDKTAGGSADMFNQARQSYNTQTQRIAPLQQSLATLRAHPDLQTGMTANDWQNLSSLAQVLGVQLSPETIANGTALNEINKNLNRYYRGLPGATRSDMAELDAKLANPTTENQRDALDDLLARTIGTERANDAAYLNFTQQHGAANASSYAHLYADQSGAYANSLDPMGFAFKEMSQSERRAYLDSLTDPQARMRYLNSVKEASRLYGLSIQ